jgi:sodium-dependent phosphate cotransporter
LFKLPKNISEKYNKLSQNKYYKFILLFIALYIFIFSIKLMGSGFKLMGSDFSEAILTTIKDPISSFFIGLLATSVIQSSSATTTILVTLCATGILPIETAIPAVIGANIGTTITNTLVSFGHITRKVEFGRAFGGSVVHDFFNILAAAILLPIEIVFHPLQHISTAMANAFVGVGGLEVASPVKMITSPIIDGLKENFAYISFLDIIFIVVGLIILFISLKVIVGCTRFFVVGRGEKLISKYLFGGALISFILGLALTSIVQSSSITTSLIIPLVGAGVLTIEKIFPYTLGANIGTTVTALLAALALGGESFGHIGITIAFVHLMFNVFAICIIYPLKPIRKIPIILAEKFGQFVVNAKKNTFMMIVVYIIIFHYVLPFAYIVLAGVL